MKKTQKKFMTLILLICMAALVSCKEQGTDFSAVERPEPLSTGNNPNDPIIPPNVVYAHAGNSDSFVQNSEQKVDILWVIDSSGSMGGEQSALASNFDTFINDFIMQSIDFKMAVTTTDSNSSSSQYDGKDGQVACDISYLNSAYADSNEQDFRDRFSDCVDVGTNGSGTERGLNGADRFLQRYGNTFIRDGAYLIIMILSDEEDKSTKTVQNYINIFASVKNNNAGLVKVYSIVNKDFGDLTGGSESVGQRYMQASTLSNGVFASIRSQFSATLSSFSTGILTLLSSFALSKKASSDPEHNLITVTVDGVTSTKYNYDSSANTIKFLENYIPATGSIIVVDYEYKYIVQ